MRTIGDSLKILATGTGQQQGETASHGQDLEIGRHWLAFNCDQATLSTWKRIFQQPDFVLHGVHFCDDVYKMAQMRRSKSLGCVLLVDWNLAVGLVVIAGSLHIIVGEVQSRFRRGILSSHC